jgi:outer membrane protein
MKKLLVAFAVMFSMGAVMAQSKLAHVNSQKLFDTLPSRVEAMNKLKEFEENGVKELEEMYKDYQLAEAKFIKDQPNMTPMLIKIEQEKLMKKQTNIQDREQALNQEMQIYSQELNKPLLERVQEAVEIVAERKKINYVIDETVTLYFKGGVDIQAEVIIELLRLDAEAHK